MKLEFRSTLARLQKQVTQMPTLLKRTRVQVGQRAGKSRTDTHTENRVHENRLYIITPASIAVAQIVLQRLEQSA